MKRSAIVRHLGNPVCGRFLASLTPRQIQAVTYYVERGFSSQETAKAMRIRKQTVLRLIGAAVDKATGRTIRARTLVMPGDEIEAIDEGVEHHIMAKV